MALNQRDLGGMSMRFFVGEAKIELDSRCGFTGEELVSPASLTPVGKELLIEALQVEDVVDLIAEYVNGPPGYAVWLRGIRDVNEDLKQNMQRVKIYQTRNNGIPKLVMEITAMCMISAIWKFRIVS